MIQKINDYQIINLNSAIERLPTRINETTIQGVKQKNGSTSGRHIYSKK